MSIIFRALVLPPASIYIICFPLDHGPNDPCPFLPRQPPCGFQDLPLTWISEHVRAQLQAVHAHANPGVLGQTPFVTSSLFLTRFGLVVIFFFPLLPHSVASNMSGIVREGFMLPYMHVQILQATA